jgi:outer membrane immunogenic protein
LALVVAAAAATAVATTASAADLPVAPAPGYNPPVYRPALYDWTGLYFGGHVGVGLMEDSVTTTTTTALQPAGTQTNLSPFSVIGGAQAGANFEVAPLVIGVEATWTSSAISGSQVTPSLAGTSERSTSNSNWYATATGRVGYAANDLLFYAKGGAAWMRVNYTQDILTGAGATSSQIISDTRTGFTVGGGIEYGMTENLSAKLEYDFLDFGTKNYNFNNLSAAGAALVLPVAIKSDTHMFTVGLNYRFNWSGGGAVAAKY